MNANNRSTDREYDANLEPVDAWLEEHLLESWDHLLFAPTGRVDREAAIVFGLLTEFCYLTLTLDDIAATFLWHPARAERALDRLEEGLREAHQNDPEFLDPMEVVRDPQRVWIRLLPPSPAQSDAALW